MKSRLLIDATTFLGKVWKLANPYWFSEERWLARGLLAAIVALTLGLVYLAVLFNDWNRQFYNSLEQKNFADFKDLLLYFCLLAVIYIAAAVYKIYLTQMLEMRWRVWLTREYLGEWLDKQVYYRLELISRGTDNPDQRIAEDLRLFTDGTLSLALGLLTSVVTLISFIAILWSVSGPLVFMLGTSEIVIPGYMLWAALLYAVAASVLTHYIGRPLIGLSFQREQREADFRFNLVRLREHAEGVALYRGESPEQQGLLARFELIRANWWELMRYTKRLTYFTAGYAQIAIIFPFVVAAPRFFAGSITLGGLTQIANAFGEVQGALSWFVNTYGTLAGWKASVDRLLTFQSALQKATQEAEESRGIRIATSGSADLRAEHLDLALPAGDGTVGRAILTDTSFRIERGSRVLISGPSGSGKSTLFRALAGIWPFGKGEVTIPAGARVLFLPQKPYLPIGTLRQAVSFPAAANAFDDNTLRETLAACSLGAFADRLDEQGNWGMSMSGGEQQRLAIARALLNRPDWLFLDEATSSLDEPTEAHLYGLLREHLPRSALVSIAHRPAVAAFHDRRFELKPSAGRSTLVAA
ncbi:MAG: ABC transporter ATP-binding protein/permease [Betaproteobacteria bacterium]|nr:ABC transporter ATP-binding protein/permease [Betaproteobacteria bacterium]